MKTTKWPIFILIAYYVINTLVIIGLAKLLFYKVNGIEVVPFALIGAALLVVCQFFLLNIKVDTVNNRPVPKRKIKVASIILALLMAILTVTAVVLLLLIQFGESPELGTNESFVFFAVDIVLIILFFGSWFFWAYAFLASYKDELPGTYIRKTVNRLMIGSVMELLVAIPSHIIFRNREDCCAPAISYFGIVLGTTVLLFAFGPGIVFLYLKRMQNKKSKKKS